MRVETPRCEHEQRTRGDRYTWKTCGRASTHYEDHEYRTGSHLRLFYCARHPNKGRQLGTVRVVGRGQL